MDVLGNVACNFKKNPTLTQDLSRRCIATRGGECVYVPSYTESGSVRLTRLLESNVFVIQSIKYRTYGTSEFSTRSTR